MEQKEFSKWTIRFLEENYPEFTQTIKFQDDGSFDCELKSESGVFSIWIATYGCEITIGIEDPTGKTDIHSHISCYELDELEICGKKLSTIIENIKGDKLVVYQDENGEYNWIESSKFKNLTGCEKLSWKK